MSIMVFLFVVTCLVLVVAVILRADDLDNYYHRMKYSPVVVWHAWDSGEWVKFPKEAEVFDEDDPYPARYVEAALVTWKGVPGPVAFYRRRYSEWEVHDEFIGKVPRIVFAMLRELIVKRNRETKHRALQTYHDTLRARSKRLALTQHSDNA